MMSKKSPQLRFEGFMDDWEERKLGDAVSISSGVTGDATLQDGKYRLTRIESISQGMLNVTRLGFTNEKPDQKYLLNLGDILYSNINSLSHIGKVALVDTTGIYHGINLLRLKMRNGVDSEFLFQRLNTMPMKNWAVSHANPAVSQASINQTELSKQPISSPTLPEQQQIGSFFKEIDNTIALHQRKLDLLKEQKKGYLQKMFPKNGAKVPELRFAGFADDWEQRKLGDEVRIVMGQSPNSENYTDDPNDYILVQGNADMKNGRVLPRVWTTQVTKQAEKDDLILSVRAPVGDIGKTAYDVVIGRGVAAIKGNEFIFQNLGKMKSDGYWTRYSTGSTFESINSTDIKEAIISVPAIEEQDKIGSFFKQLDNTIALHQRKLDLLKEQKKGFLQKMFV